MQIPDRHSAVSDLRKMGISAKSRRGAEDFHMKTSNAGSKSARGSLTVTIEFFGWSDERGTLHGCGLLSLPVQIAAKFG